MAEETIGDQVLVHFLPLLCGLGQHLLYRGAATRCLTINVTVTLGLILLILLLRAAYIVVRGLRLYFLLAFGGLDHTEGVL